jgi:tripartite-type tricarboxylate transporter receptor subunit TctC
MPQHAQASQTKLHQRAAQRCSAGLKLLSLLALGVTTLGAAAHAQAQNPAATASNLNSFPNHSVRIVVGFPSGSLLDVLARAIGDELRKPWGQAVVVENRAGADSIIASETVAKSPADGHTLFLATLGALGLNPHLYRKLPYDPANDFAGVSFVADSPFGLGVNVDLPVKNVQELIAMAKASPGKLNYASGASFAQMVGEAFKRTAAVDIAHIPYKGVQPAVTDLIAGRAQVIFGDVPSLMPSYKGGKMRLIGVTGNRRSVIAPEVPTIAESGLSGYDYATWYAFVAPAGTPKPLLEKLSADITATLNGNEMKQRFLSLGLEPRPSRPEVVDQLIRSEITRWGPVVRGAGIQAQ